MTPATIETAIVSCIRSRLVPYGRSRFVRLCVRVGGLLAIAPPRYVEQCWTSYYTLLPLKLWWNGWLGDDA